MTTADRKNEYLVKSKDAEVREERSMDESDKAEWLRIAAGYHALAAHQDQRRDNSISAGSLGKWERKS